MPKCDFNKVGLLCKFIEIILRHGCSPVNLLHIFRTPLPKNTSGLAASDLSLLLTMFVILHGQLLMFVITVFGIKVELR